MTAPSLTEIELKFVVPAASSAAVARAVGTATASRVRLQAVYADTADQRLAAAGCVLRLRREGRRWVQTLKGRGDDLMTRLEHEVPLDPEPGTRGPPRLDPARHAGTPAGDALAALLADGAPLVPQYRTDIQRLQRRVRHAGAVVELAFDSGRIVAGSRSVPVCELELELVSGPPDALLALAERWVPRFGLHLDVRTKSERGHRLALGLDRVPAATATPTVWPKDTPPGLALGAMLQGGLAHLLPNAAELTAGDGGPEHLHQARVALRRLRTALRLYGAWSADPAAAAALETALRDPFSRLGAARDADALGAALLPELNAALLAAGGAPLALPPAAAAESPADVLSEPAFTVLVLQTLRLALRPPVEGPGRLGDAVRAVLKPAWRRVRRGAAAFAQAQDEDRHRLRRRLKRLRYAMEFVLPALPARRAGKALAALRQALNALGAYNDAVVAEQRFAAEVATQPQAWFALGWLAARREALLARAARRLAALADAPRAWR